MDAFATETIRYGGRDFAIRPPSFRHVRVIVPAAARVMPKLELMIVARDWSVVDEKLMDDAFTIVHAGIASGGDTMTREQLEALPCDMGELFAAVPRVMAIAGLKPKQEEPASGEAQAGTA